jgi:hypothetical protein
MATTQTPRQPDSTDEQPRTRRGVRRTAVVGAVAAVCAVAIAVPFALHGGHDAAAPRTAPTSSTPPQPQARHGALIGDVDGNGLPDQVVLSARGVLKVALDSGTTVRHLIPGDSRLEGLVHVGTPGSDIATSQPTHGSRGSAWSVWHLLGTSLSTVPLRHHTSLGSDRDSQVAWVAGGTLYDGRLDVLQKAQDRVAVLARAWSLDRAGLAPSRTGVWCWDRSTGQPPARCAPGQDWTPDVGPHGDLPAMQPFEASWFKAATDPVVDGADSWTLVRATPPGPAEAPRMDLVLRSAGSTAQVLVPRGWPPVLRAEPVTPGALHGVLISQEGGDSDTWRVYVDHDGRPVEVPTDGPVALGGGFMRDTGSTYISWVSDAGQVFTRVGTPDLGRYRVYEWEPVAATGSSLPVLRARDLGIVCFDDLFGHYGTCAS